MENKKPWQSKTNWIALLMAISSFFPQVQAVIASSPEAFASTMSAVFIFLRFISKDKISIS